MVKLIDLTTKDTKNHEKKQIHRKATPRTKSAEDKKERKGKLRSKAKEEKERGKN